MSTFNAPNYLAHPPRPHSPPRWPRHESSCCRITSGLAGRAVFLAWTYHRPPLPPPLPSSLRIELPPCCRKNPMDERPPQVALVQSQRRETASQPHWGRGDQTEKTRSVVVVSPAGRQGNCEAGNMGVARVRAVWQPRRTFMPCHRVRGGRACRVRGDFHRMRLVASMLMQQESPRRQK